MAHVCSAFKIFGQKFFFQKPTSVTHNFIWVSSTTPKFRKELMTEFQGNTQEDKRTNITVDRKTEEQTDPISQDPLRYHSKTQKCL